MTQERDWPAFEVVRRNTEVLTPSARNARRHSKAQIEQIAQSILSFGWTTPLLIDDKNTIIAGHGRHMAAQKLAIPELPCIIANGWTEAECRAYALADNKIAENADWDVELLRVELEYVDQSGLALENIGFNTEDMDAVIDGLNTIPSRKSSGALARKFGFPPFSVLNARDGRWAERKQKWIELGIRSETGRDESLLLSSSSDFMTEAIKQTGGGTSIFDPVLCELLYNWFCPEGGDVLDPFAGGSVRGIVAAHLGRRYTGIELRDEQVVANCAQAKDIEMDAAPQWILGDSLCLDTLIAPDYECDFMFSCPPYGDLEQYSQDVRDLSNMPYETFIEAYSTIIAKSCARLKPDRFAAFVVGEIRDRKGIYRSFVPHTIAAFQAAGLRYYNEAILVTQAGSLPLRTGRQFSSSRKLGKTHQNILIFVKGDPKQAAAACPVMEDNTVDNSDNHAA
jgi:DNA modification methylase